jgi:magnesium-transporting ATPase (P-type)
MKPLTIAYRDFAKEEFDELMATNENFETEESRKVIESQLTLVATFGLEDPLREGVQEAYMKLFQANANVRILSGDHRDAAVAAAVSVGILQSLDQDEGVVNSEDLQAALDELLIEVDETEREGENRGKTWAFRNKESEKAFRTGLKRNVVVVYRATPRVKTMFAAAIRMSGSPCGVTGESLNDARALSEGTVGFAMG